MYRAIINASELITGSGVRKKDGRHVQEDDLGVIKGGALVYSVKNVNAKEIPDKIMWVGSTSDLPKEYEKINKLDLNHKRVLMPGLVDCHTHLVFAGDRSSEFAKRCAGATYAEIANMGGGILTTVNATRAASEDELEELAVGRLREMTSFGVKTLEIKSGYGLTVNSELKMLRVIKRLKNRFPEIKILSTFLGAHAYPKGMKREKYLDLLLNEMIPEVASHKLADACDVFIDDGYFTIDEGRKILSAAKSKGLKIKIHADELVGTGSAELAVTMGALSADHLLKISDAGISALAGAQTVGVVLPGTAFYLKAPYAPVRKMIDAGVCVALSTDFNPGSSMCLSLPIIMTLSALYMGMTKAEIFASVTYNAAKALGLEHTQGTLVARMDADFTILPFESFEESYYRFGWVQI